MRQSAKIHLIPALSLLLCLIVAAAAIGGPLTIGQQAIPEPVARGEILTLAIAITNTGALALIDLIFQDPLPTGVDQLNAEVRLKAGGWMAFPVNGIIPLGTIDGGDTVSVEIRARIEHSAAGSITNTVTVSNNLGPLATSSLLVNLLPAVDAGADKMVGPGGVATLSDASAGDGGDGIASYSWSDSGAGGSFDDNAALHTAYTAPGSGGVVTLTLTVTDHQGGQASDSLRMRVNTFPTVNAGADRTVDEGTPVALSDAGASDGDGWIASILWDDRGAGGTFFPSTNVINPSYTAPLTPSCDGEELTLTITVTDNWGARSSASLTLHVTNVNVSPSADAGVDRTVAGKETVVLIGNGDDPDGQIVRFAWEQLSGPAVALSESSTAQPSFVTPSVPADTAFRFRLTVTDNCGACAIDEVTVTVEPCISPDPAMLSLVKVADRETASLGEHITYTYTVTNTGEATLYEVKLTDDRLGDLDPGSDRLAAGETTTTTAVGTVAESDLPGPLVNTATASAQDKAGTPLCTTATASVDLLDPRTKRSSIEVGKEAHDARGFPLSSFSPLALGDTITYVFTVTNTGETTLSDIAAVDDLLGAVALDRSTLGPWEKARGTVEKTIQESDFPGPLENTIVATAVTPTGTNVTDSDTLRLLGLSGQSKLELAVEADTDRVGADGSIAFTYTVANSGDTTVSELRLIDDLSGTVRLPTTVLAPGEQLTVSLQADIAGEYLSEPLVHTATITGIDSFGETTSAESAPLVIVLDEIVDERARLYGEGDIAGAGGAMKGATTARQRVIINEIAWAGTPTSPGDEWIELRNLGTMPVDLDGWSLCWYPKGETVPSQELWHRIELTGIIDASPIDLSVRREWRPEITFLKRTGETNSWQVLDMSWWVAGKDGVDGRGYYLLERKHDGVIDNVIADLIYDVDSPRATDLPDSGAVLLLLNAAGEVVDRANSEHTDHIGWPAGNARTGATMERTDPFAGDIVANWHTNQGVFVYGLDSAGNRLAATAGKPNSLDLAELTLLAEAEVTPRPTAATIRLAIGKSTQAERPWIHVATPQSGIAGGGGGAHPTLSFSSVDTKAGSQLEISTAGFPPGTYYVWITGKAGEAILLAFTVGS